MSDAARARLGDWQDLLEIVGPEQRGDMQRFLRECQAGDVFVGLCATGRKKDVPVRFSCLLRALDRLVLAAEVKQRAADRLGKHVAGLTSLESRMLQHYFRLVRAHQLLNGRGRGRRNAGPSSIAQLDRERARLGRELHTGAGQAYSAIRHQLEWIERRAPDLPPEIRDCLRRIGKAAQDADTEVRAVSKWLHPPDWQALQLADAVRGLWNDTGIPETFQASLTLGPFESEPPHPVRVAVYRIVQEGLANVIRHSGATELSLALEQVARCVRVRLQDNGQGFQGPGDGKGLGLRSIRDQVQALNGEMQIQTGAGGTTLEVTIPMDCGDD
jgi:signal transduction histidine kinase